MKNKITDLNDHLFAAIERLSDDNFKGPELMEEIERSKAIQGIAANIINSAKVQLDFARAFGDDKIMKSPGIFAELAPNSKSKSND